MAICKSVCLLFFSNESFLTVGLVVMPSAGSGITTRSRMNLSLMTWEFKTQLALNSCTHSFSLCLFVYVYLSINLSLSAPPVIWGLKHLYYQVHVIKLLSSVNINVQIVSNVCRRCKLSLYVHDFCGLLRLRCRKGELLVFTNIINSW